MSFPAGGYQLPKQKRPHPYLTGNFAPIHRTLPLTPCSHSGTIPLELAGGQYVRNGGNPLTNEDLGRDAHWFDGDGMLSGVLFRRTAEGIRPEFVNQFLLTDLYLNAADNSNLKRPVLPSITTLINPLASFVTILAVILRTIALVALSHLPGSRHKIKKISVANTAVMYHDGRALATCESGPPLRFLLPSLETVGWYNGRHADNEAEQDSRLGFGGAGPSSFIKEWTTGHPRVDQDTNELISFHSGFVYPYIHYSIVPATKSCSEKESCTESQARFNMPVPGVTSPKMMHDFGVSKKYTVILDLPLSLDPMNIVRGTPAVSYNPNGRSRFGVFPRRQPQNIQWFETNPCVIFHTANCWDSCQDTRSKISFQGNTVNLLVCRLTSASLVYSAGAISPPAASNTTPLEYLEDEQCRLYYYSFDLGNQWGGACILHQWALSAISFEFPTLCASREMKDAQFIYGCSTGSPSYSVALGRDAKIEYLSKFNVKLLIARGVANPPQSIKGCVDSRTVGEVLQSSDPDDPIQLFALPPGHYGQEPRFVSRESPTSEDDGWLLTYVFDESQLDECGMCRSGSFSELWIINAKTMTDVVAKIRLPQRVPYGLHGNWFNEHQIAGQRGYRDIRRRHEVANTPSKSRSFKLGEAFREKLENVLG